MLATALANHRDAVTDFHRLDGIDAHHGGGDVGIELVEYRLAEPRRHAPGAHRNARADRVAGAAYVPYELLELGQALRIGTEERVVIRRAGLAWRQRERADLTQVAVDAHLEAFGQVFARNRTGRHAHHGLARRGSPAAAMIAPAVLLLIRIVGMAGTKTILQPIVVARARVGVLDQQPDRCAGGLALEHAR